MLIVPCQRTCVPALFSGPPLSQFSPRFVKFDHAAQTSATRHAGHPRHTRRNVR